MFDYVEMKYLHSWQNSPSMRLIVMTLNPARVAVETHLTKSHIHTASGAFRCDQFSVRKTFRMSNQ